MERGKLIHKITDVRLAAEMFHSLLDNSLPRPNGEDIVEQ